MSDTLMNLSKISARIGTDPMLIQGAGGNTSVKIGSTLWVKASGLWLENADQADIFVSLDLEGIRNAIDTNEGERFDQYLLNADAGLRPSIETSLHALLPQSVVIHVHSVRTLAWAVRNDAPDRLRERLSGLRWKFVPYHRPGLPLTLAIREVVRLSAPDVFVLGNHGLVVAAADCSAAASLLEEVEGRLDTPSHEPCQPDLPQLSTMAQGGIYRLPVFEVSHSLAMSPRAISIVSGGSMYPDHVVFLGTRVHSVEPGSELPVRAGATNLPAMIIVRGAGTLIRSDLSLSAKEMVRALALVVAHLPAYAPINYLSSDEESSLLGWDAEKYRQLL